MLCRYAVLPVYTCMYFCVYVVHLVLQNETTWLRGPEIRYQLLAIIPFMKYDVLNQPEKEQTSNQCEMLDEDTFTKLNQNYNVSIIH